MKSAPPDSTDPELFRRMQRGDIDALAVLYDRYAEWLFSLALRILGDGDAATEVVQETFLHLWENGDQFSPANGSLPVRLIGLARNRAADRLRSRKRYRDIQRDPVEQAPTEARQAGGAAELFEPTRRASMRGALDSLPEEQREFIQLALFSGLTQTEIAGVLQLPSADVKEGIRQGMMRLRESVETGDEGASTDALS